MRIDWVKIRMDIGRKYRGAVMTRVLQLTVILCCFMVIGAAKSSAQPPAPAYMPGFPMIAGPQVMVMWSPVPGAKAYRVYRNGELLQETNVTQFFDQVGDSPAEYRYQISAVSVDGKEGPKSQEKVIKVIKLEAPQSVMGRVIGNTVAIRWQGVESAQVYNVYRSEKNEPGSYKLLSSVTVDSYKDSDVEMGKKYFYKVSAKDISGKESPRSEPTIIETRVAAARDKGAKEVKLYLRKTKTVHVFKNGLEMQSGSRVDLRAPFDMVVAQDRVFISHTGNSRISAFNKDTGMFLFDIGREGRMAKGDSTTFGFQRVTALGLNPDGDKLFAMDVNEKKIYVFTLDGSPITSFIPEPGEKLTEQWRMYHFDVDNDENVWIPDIFHQKIRIFDTSGREIRSFGKEGEISFPGFCKLDLKNNRFFVVSTDRREPTITVFDLNGKFINKFGKKGVGGGYLWSPAGIDVLDDGSLIQADGINSIINVFDPTSGELKYHLIDEDGKTFVQIASARGIKVEGDKVYVASSIIDEVDVLEMFGDPFLAK